MPFDISEPFARALDARGYQEPTPVQEAVLAADAVNRDLLVSAQTGSGKTVAYGLAMAEAILEDGALPPAGDPLALIIAPTRELALQVQAELTWLYAHVGAQVSSCVGGMDPIRERRRLERGVHIVVGTPGRLRDHMERGGLHLESLKAVVIDEADEMLDLGFHDDLEYILKTTPAGRRTFLFSATLPGPIVKLAQNYQQDAYRIAIADEGGHADIEYRAVRIAHAKAERAVVNILRLLDPASAIVFCATRAGVNRLGETLAARGFDAVALSGEMTQNERNRALQALREGRARVCVATDVAARGLDIPNLSLVVHADLPHDAEALQHRSGRTGRAGKKGISILLVPPSRRRLAEMMLQRARVQYAWMTPPSPKEIYEQDRERILQSPLLTEPGDDVDNAIADALAGRFPADRLALALARLFRAQWPAPEDVEEYVEEPRRSRPSGTDAPGRRERSPQTKKRRPAKADRPVEHALPGETVWFRIAVGRERNADPNWLLPEICRQGDVTKNDVGEIRVYDAETRFELNAAVAEDFTARVGAHKKGGVNIYPAFGGEPDASPQTEMPPDGPSSDRRPEPARRPPDDRRHEKDARKKFDKAKRPRAKTPADPDRKQKRKARKKEKRRLAALLSAAG